MDDFALPHDGDLILLVSPRGKRRMLRLENDGKHDLHTQDGVLTMSDLAATPFGGEAFTSLGVPFRVQRPALYDLVMGIKRQTQIMYPKDMGLICFKLGVGPGRTILEAGSGSGGFTLALSWFAGPSGRVHTFEAREEFHKLARRNLAWAGHRGRFRPGRSRGSRRPPGRRPVFGRAHPLGLSRPGGGRPGPRRAPGLSAAHGGAGFPPAAGPGARPL